MYKLIIIIFLLGTLAILWTGCEKDPTTQGNGACSTITDSRDGETYSVVKIGDQCWMAENLRFNATGSWINPNNPSVAYGCLYDWSTVMNGESSSSSSPSGVQGLCPSGWHLPSDIEWKTLEISLGLSSSDADLWGQYRGTHGKEMKSTTGWDNSESSANSSGFNVFPSAKYLSGFFVGLGERANFWSATESSVTEAWHRRLYDNISGVDRFYSDKTEGFSCRCVKE